MQHPGMHRLSSLPLIAFVGLAGVTAPPPARADDAHFFSCARIEKPGPCAPYHPLPGSDPYVFRLLKSSDPVVASAHAEVTTVHGDGAGDDRCAIQGAIDAAPLGGTVILPAGVYVVCGTLKITRPVSLRGEGTKLRAFPAGLTLQTPGAELLQHATARSHYRLPATPTPSWNLGTAEAILRKHNYSSDIGGTVIYSVAPYGSTDLYVGIDIQLTGAPGPVNLSDFILVGPPSVPPEAVQRTSDAVRTNTIGIRAGSAGSSGIVGSEWKNLAAPFFEKNFVLFGSSGNVFNGLQVGASTRGLVVDGGSSGNLFLATNGGAAGKAIELRDGSVNHFEDAVLQGIYPRLRYPACPRSPHLPVVAGEHPEGPVEYGAGVALEGGELNTFEGLYLENAGTDQELVSNAGVHNIVAHSVLVSADQDEELTINGGAFLKLVQIVITISKSFAPVPQEPGRSYFGGTFIDPATHQPYTGLRGHCAGHLPADALADPANALDRPTCGLDWYKALERQVSSPEECPAHFYWPTDYRTGGEMPIHPGGIFVNGGVFTRIIDLPISPVRGKHDFTNIYDARMKLYTKPDGRRISTLTFFDSAGRRHE